MFITAHEGTNIMITWHEELAFDFSNPITDCTFTENTVFFDIETTGFSPARTSLYLIGCATRKGNLLCIDQFFAEKKEEEADVLTAFLGLLARYDRIVTFNGIGFDIPYLKGKCAAYHIKEPFSSHTYTDIYKEISRIKSLLALPNLKQKSVEAFLGIEREDSYSGGELIEVYKEYTRHPSKEALCLLRQHNFEDVRNMPGLLPILAYQRFLNGDFTVVSLKASEYCAMDGSKNNKELFFTLSLSCPIPASVSFSYEDYYLSVRENTACLRVKLFEGELRFFFENPKDYYYLPNEDLAVHKSIASYVDKEHRRQATAANCYTKKNAIFVPQCQDIVTPAFLKQPKDKSSFFELTEDFITSADVQYRYIAHILKAMSSRKK